MLVFIYFVGRNSVFGMKIIRGVDIGVLSIISIILIGALFFRRRFFIWYGSSGRFGGVGRS